VEAVCCLGKTVNGRAACGGEQEEGLTTCNGLGKAQTARLSNERNKSAAMAAEEGRRDPAEPDRERARESDPTSQLAVSLPHATPVFTGEDPPPS